MKQLLPLFIIRLTLSNNLQMQIFQVELQCETVRHVSFRNNHLLYECDLGQQSYISKYFDYQSRNISLFFHSGSLSTSVISSYYDNTLTNRIILVSSSYQSSIIFVANQTTISSRLSTVFTQRGNHVLAAQFTNTSSNYYTIKNQSSLYCNLREVAATEEVGVYQIPVYSILQLKFSHNCLIIVGFTTSAQNQIAVLIFNHTAKAIQLNEKYAVHARFYVSKIQDGFYFISTAQQIKKIPFSSPYQSQTVINLGKDIEGIFHAGSQMMGVKTVDPFISVYNISSLELTANISYNTSISQQIHQVSLSEYGFIERIGSTVFISKIIQAQPPIEPEQQPPAQPQEQPQIEEEESTPSIAFGNFLSVVSLKFVFPWVSLLMLGVEEFSLYKYHEQVEYSQLIKLLMHQIDLINQIKVKPSFMKFGDKIFNFKLFQQDNQIYSQLFHHNNSKGYGLNKKDMYYFSANKDKFTFGLLTDIIIFAVYRLLRLVFKKLYFKHRTNKKLKTIYTHLNNQTIIIACFCMFFENGFIQLCYHCFNQFSLLVSFDLQTKVNCFTSVFFMFLFLAYSLLFYLFVRKYYRKSSSNLIIFSKISKKGLFLETMRFNFFRLICAMSHSNIFPKHQTKIICLISINCFMVILFVFYLKHFLNFFIFLLCTSFHIACVYLNTLFFLEWRSTNMQRRANIQTQETIIVWIIVGLILSQLCFLLFRFLFESFCSSKRINVSPQDEKRVKDNFQEKQKLRKLSALEIEIIKKKKCMVPIFLNKKYGKNIFTQYNFSEQDLKMKKSNKHGHKRDFQNSFVKINKNKKILIKQSCQNNNCDLKNSQVKCLKLEQNQSNRRLIKERNKKIYLDAFLKQLNQS